MQEKAEFTTPQRVAVVLETETAVMLISEGLLTLAREINSPHRLNLPLLLLAQGFERLLKLVIVLGRFEFEHTLVESKTLKKRYGHQLLKLKEDAVKLMAESDYAKPSTALRDDFEFLNDSEDLRVLLSALEAYARYGRYHDLEALTGNNAQFDLHGLVSMIQSRFTEKRPEFLQEAYFRSDPSLGIFHSALLADLSVTILRFTRALSRTYTFGLLGEYGLRSSPVLNRFLRLSDDELALPFQGLSSNANAD